MLGDHFCIHAVLVHSHGDQATEPVDKSCGKLAAALGMDGPIEKPFVHVKNKNLYCRALLLASGLLVARVLRLSANDLDSRIARRPST